MADKDNQNLKYDDNGIFIIGCQRSGTTLLRILLDSHPDLCAGEETHILSYMEQIVTKRWIQIEEYGIPKKDVLNLIKTFFLTFHHKNCDTTGKKRWVDKTPLYCEHLPFINELFPKCKIIHIIRDGRDVAASVKDKWGKSNFFSSLYIWPTMVRSGTSCKNQLGKDRYFELLYEDLVQDPESVLMNLTNFLKIQWDDALLNHSAVSHVITIKQPQIDKKPLHPISQSSVGSWKNRLCWYEKAFVHLGFCNLLSEFGYINPPFSKSALWNILERLISKMGFFITRVLYRLKK